MRRWALLPVLSLFGCGSQTLPPVSIASVVPGGMVASQPTNVRVQVDAQLAIQVNFGQSTLAVDTQMQVLIGPVVLGSGTYPPGGLVDATLPTVLAPGSYDATVQMGDGRTAVSHDAFTVTPGTWPSAYTIDSVGDQRSAVAFPVTVRAVGPAAPTFEGNVLLSLIGSGTLSPEVSGAFSAGVRVETVVISGTGEFILLASDIAGGTGQSPSFTVGP
ncbi:MAG: hypothetical protein ACLQDQ_09965 [Myxococcaceae bacterium]